MFIIWCIIWFVVGFVGKHNETKHYNEIQQARINEQLQAIETKRYNLQDELNMLYSELDILARIEDVERLNGVDTTKPLSESELKKALATQKKIHSIIKRIHTIEYQLNRL